MGDNFPHVAEGTPGSLVGAGTSAARGGMLEGSGADVISGNRTVTQHIFLPRRSGSPAGQLGQGSGGVGPDPSCAGLEEQSGRALSAAALRCSWKFARWGERRKLTAPLETAEIHPSPFHFLITNTPQNLSQAALMRPHVFPPSQFTGSYS